MIHSPFNVIIGVHAWNLTGINVFAEHLARGLLARGIPTHILATEHDTELVSLPKGMMQRPADVPIRDLPVGRKDDWAAHWLATIRYLHDHAPCVYLPTSDYRHSCISPKLSSRVVVVGTIQADDPLHYDHAARLGPYWNAIVGVSDACSDKTAALNPFFAARVHTIPNGVPVPAQPPVRDAAAERPLRIIYHGVLNTWQKRILDIPLIAEALRRREIPFELTIAGSGPQEEELRAACDEFVKQGMVRFAGLVPNHEVSRLLSQHDAYLLTSAFEGMPHAMLEAMAVGCVPVVTDIQSGIREVVQHRVNGFRVEVGNISQFADSFAFLHQNPAERSAMGTRAFATVRDGRYNVESMVDSYVTLFRQSMKDTQRGVYRRPVGKVSPPPAEIAGLSIFPVDHAKHVDQVERQLQAGDGARSPVARITHYAQRMVRYLTSGGTRK